MRPLVNNHHHSNPKLSHRKWARPRLSGDTGWLILIVVLETGLGCGSDLPPEAVPLEWRDLQVIEKNRVWGRVEQDSTPVEVLVWYPPERVRLVDEWGVWREGIAYEGDYNWEPDLPTDFQRRDRVASVTFDNARFGRSGEDHLFAGERDSVWYVASGAADRATLESLAAAMLGRMQAKGVDARLPRARLDQWLDTTWVPLTPISLGSTYHVIAPAETLRFRIRTVPMDLHARSDRVEIRPAEGPRPYTCRILRGGAADVEPILILREWLCNESTEIRFPWGSRTFALDFWLGLSSADSTELFVKQKISLDGPSGTTTWVINPKGEYYRQVMRFWPLVLSPTELRAHQDEAGWGYPGAGPIPPWAVERMRRAGRWSKSAEDLWRLDVKNYRKNGGVYEWAP